MDDARGECNQITYGDMPLPLSLFLMRMRDYDAMRQFQSVLFSLSPSLEDFELS